MSLQAFISFWLLFTIAGVTHDLNSVRLLVWHMFSGMWDDQCKCNDDQVVNTNIYLQYVCYFFFKNAENKWMSFKQEHFLTISNFAGREWRAISRLWGCCHIHIARKVLLWKQAPDYRSIRPCALDSIVTEVQPLS